MPSMSNWPRSWLTASRFAPLAAPAPENIRARASRNAPAKTLENECASEESCDDGAEGGGGGGGGPGEWKKTEWGASRGGGGPRAGGGAGRPPHQVRAGTGERREL